MPTLDLKFELLEHRPLPPEYLDFICTGLHENIEQQLKYLSAQLGYAVTYNAKKLHDHRRGMSKDEWFYEYQKLNLTDILVCLHKGRIVGFVEFMIHDLFSSCYDLYVRNCASVELKQIYVDKKYRRTKIGTALINEAYKRAQSYNHVKYLTLNVNAFNYSAISFFCRLHMRVAENHYCIQDVTSSSMGSYLQILKPQLLDPRYDDPAFAIASRQLREQIRVDAHVIPELGAMETQIVNKVCYDIINERRFVCLLNAGEDGWCSAGVAGGGMILMQPLIFAQDLYRSSPSKIKAYIETLAHELRKAYDADTFVIRATDRDQCKILESQGCKLYQQRYIL